MNRGEVPIVGTATFNVTPFKAASYFSKLECFCFTEQTLQPGEEVVMPVLFYVDPRLLSDPDTAEVRQLTLSYTFFQVDAGNMGKRNQPVAGRQTIRSEG
jgi:cytochrome c oxidase assembly protein subunit 11